MKIKLLESFKKDEIGDLVSVDGPFVYRPITKPLVVDQFKRFAVFHVVVIPAAILTVFFTVELRFVLYMLLNLLLYTGYKLWVTEDPLFTPENNRDATAVLGASPHRQTNLLLAFFIIAVSVVFFLKLSMLTVLVRMVISWISIVGVHIFFRLNTQTIIPAVEPPISSVDIQEIV